MIRVINLVLSSKCNANCIFCPSDRGENIRKKTMSFCHIKKIVKDIHNENKKKRHNIRLIRLSENGEALLNPNFIKIVRYIKYNLPYVQVQLYTNFQLLNPAIARIIIREKLINSILFNIDGATKENYYIAKKLNFNVLIKNLKSFVKLRKEYESNINLMAVIMTLRNYIKGIYAKHRVYPMKLKDANFLKKEDDSEEIRKILAEILNPELDGMNISVVLGWAEREQIETKDIDYRMFDCPNLGRVETESFIAPDGSWYACCFDSKNELIFGNVFKRSINSVFNGKKRNEFIELLKKRKFEKIGGPCKTVMCCSP